MLDAAPCPGAVTVLDFDQTHRYLPARSLLCAATRGKERAVMATRTRLLLSSTGGPFGSKNAVYDVISQQHAQRRFSSAEMCSSKVACAALTTVKGAARELCVRQELLDAMHAQTDLSPTMKF